MSGSLVKNKFDYKVKKYLDHKDRANGFLRLHFSLTFPEVKKTFYCSPNLTEQEVTPLHYTTIRYVVTMITDLLPNNVH